MPVDLLELRARLGEAAAVRRGVPLEDVGAVHLPPHRHAVDPESELLG